MDSLKTSSLSAGSVGIYWMDLIPWTLMVAMLCLNIVYLLYKIRNVRDGSSGTS